LVFTSGHSRLLKRAAGITDLIDVVSEVPPSSTPPPGAKPLWGSFEGKPVPAAHATPAAPAPAAPTRTAGASWLFGGEELEPISRHLLQAAGALSLLLVLVVANSFLNQGSASPFNPNPVAQAAERTQEVPGMQMSIVSRTTSEGQPPVTITGRGAYNGETKLAGITYHVTTSAGAPMEFDAVLGDSNWYFRYPQLAGRIPGGKEWIKLDSLISPSDSSTSAENPEDSLRVLSAAGSVQRLGEAKVRKVQTTRYRAQLTAQGVLQGLRDEGQDDIAEVFEKVASQVVGPIKAEIFIDQQGMVRRMYTVTKVIENGTVVTSATHIDLFDFGAQPQIQVPDESRVFDMTPVMEEKLGALGQSS
jgi:hypothetical protein